MLIPFLILVNPSISFEKRSPQVTWHYIIDKSALGLILS